MKKNFVNSRGPTTNHPNPVIFGMIALVVLLIISIFIPNPTSFQYLVYRILLALAAAGIAAAIPGVIRLQLGTRVLAVGAIAIFVIVFWSNPARIPEQPIRNEIPSPIEVPSPIPTRIVHVAVLLNGNANYVQNSRSSFQETLASFLRKKGFELHMEEEVGSPKEEGINENKAAIERLLARFPGRKPDYFVTIGTAVSEHAKQLLANQQIPQVFIAVTNPIASKLVTSLHGDPSRGSIAGTTYPPSPNLLMEKLHRFFPDERLGFIYSSKYPQDVALKKAIESISSTVTFIETAQVLLTEAQIRSATVFFGKYMLCSNVEAFSSKYPQLKFIAASAANATKGALATIGPEDSELGRRAALEIIIPNLMEGQSLALMDIIEPETHVTVNVTTARLLDADIKNLISDPSVKQIVSLATLSERKSRDPWTMCEAMFPSQFSQLVW